MLNTLTQNISGQAVPTVATTTSEDIRTGDVVIPVVSSTGFRIGDRVRIGPVFGTNYCEHIRIKNFGSIISETPVVGPPTSDGVWPDGIPMTVENLPTINVDSTAAATTSGAVGAATSDPGRRCREEPGAKAQRASRTTRRTQRGPRPWGGHAPPQRT